MSSSGSPPRPNTEAAVALRYSKVRAEQEEAARAIDENTERLRSLRLAREAREPGAARRGAKANRGNGR